MSDLIIKRYCTSLFLYQAKIGRNVHKIVLYFFCTRKIKTVKYLLYGIYFLWNTCLWAIYHKNTVLMLLPVFRVWYRMFHIKTALVAAGSSHTWPTLLLALVRFFRPKVRSHSWDTSPKPTTTMTLTQIRDTKLQNMDSSSSDNDDAWIKCPLKN